MTKRQQAIFYKKLGANIRAARLALVPKITQEHLGAYCDLTRTSIANIEAGKQKILLDDLVDLAHFLQDANLKETLAGRIVLSVGCNTKSDNDLFGSLDSSSALELKEQLDKLHKQKIDLADEILVLNVDGYIGESTRSEIAHAKAQGKTVRYLEPID